MKPKRIAALESLARDMVGDDKAPNLFFISDQGQQVMITRDFEAAYQHWRTLASRRPLVESALEDRQTGVLASVEPDSDEPAARLEVRDDTHYLRKLRRKTA